MLCSWHLARRIRTNLRSHLGDSEVVGQSVKRFWDMVYARCTSAGIETIKASTTSLLESLRVDPEHVKLVVKEVEGERR